MKKLIYVLPLVLSFPLYAEEVPGKTLLTYFSGSCKTSSQWTQAALADSEALVRSLNAMSADPDCASAAGAISQLNGLSAQLLIMDRLGEAKNTLANINAEEQELLIQLTKSSDSAVLREINASLRQLQVNRAKILKGDRSAEQLSGVDKVTLLGQIAQSANSSFQQITANEKCLKKHPSLLNSATSIMAGVGAAVTMVNPAIGLSMTAGATFTKVAMDGIQKGRQARQIRKIADSTITFEAYSCALESMADRWCQMQDADLFLKFKAENRRGSLLNQDLAQAISLNDREIPVILDWLNKLRNGVTPRTTADAGRREAVLTRELIVRAKSDFGLSLIEQNRTTYDSLASKPEDQWYFLRTIISSLAPQMSMGSSSGQNQTKDPMKDIYPAMYSPYYLIGLRDDDPRIRNQGNIALFDSWTRPADLVVTLDSVKTKYIEWVERAANLVNRELTEVQQPDPLQTLSSANIEAEPWMVTPLDAFKTIADFLEENPPGEGQRDFTRVYQDTLKKLRKIHDITTVAIATGNMDPRPIADRSLTPIEEIYETAQLKYGIVVLQARLEMIVRISLLELIKNSPEADQIVVAQLLASDRFYETISRMNGTTSYASLREDIRTGKAYTMKNLSSFMEIFGHNINRTLRSLYWEERNATPTVAQSNRDLRTSMCFLALGAENASDWIDTDLCEGLKMQAMQPGGPESITLNHETFTQDLGKRACTYREFFRQSDIYQKWRIKNQEAELTY
jgi:hypothetical protein